MKLERLESIPDEVDAKLFAPLIDRTKLAGIRSADELLAEVLADLSDAGLDAIVRVDENDNNVLSHFGVLNSSFRHYCPGYRLMVTEDQPTDSGMMTGSRKLWVCREVE